MGGRTQGASSGLIWMLAAAALAGCQRSPAPEPSAPVAPAATPRAADAAKAQAVNPEPDVRSYLCENGETVQAGYPSRDTAVVTWRGRPYPLKLAISGSGARYTGYGVQWWTKGMDDGRLSQLKPGEEIASDPGVACHAGDPADAPVEPPAPGTPGGLPDDRTPVSEAPFTPESAQGAANVVQTYYALIAEKKYAQAWRLWSDGGRASNQTQSQFEASFAKYRSYNAQVGGPSDMEGAAGSSYVQVPVVIYGRLNTGSEVHESGSVTLRRVNDVPGSTAEQRRWHITRIDLRPTPGG